MGLLQQSKAIFYHPLNDADEYIKTKTWTGTNAPVFASGKVSLAATAVISAPTMGSEAEFLDGNVEYPTVEALTSDKAVIVYNHDFGSQEAFARIAMVSGTSVSFGPAHQLSSGNGTRTVVGVLSSTKFLAAYLVSEQTTTLVVGTVSGTDITSGTPLTVAADAGGTRPDVAGLDSNKAVVYYYSGGSIYVAVATMSGVDVTVGAGTALTGSRYQKMLARLGSAKFVVLDGSNARVGTVSGTDVTLGPANAIGATGKSVVALGSSKIVVLWTAGLDSTAKVGAVSGTDITFGSDVAAVTGSKPGVVRLDSATVVVVSSTQSKIGVVSGTDITFGSATAMGITIVNRFHAGAINNGFIAVYDNGNDTSDGYAKVGQSPRGADLSGLTGDYDSAAAATKVGFCGWFRKPSA